MKRLQKMICTLVSVAFFLGLMGVTSNADNGFKVNRVGVLDTSPTKNFADFGETLLWQAAFSEEIYGSDDLPSDPGKRAIYVQGQFGDYIVINGKTVTQWNSEDYDCVTIHIGENSVLGVYMEFNTKKSTGLISADTDNYVTFLKGFPSASGSTLSENITFYLAAGSTNPFEIVDSSKAVIPEIPDESEIELDVREIGVLDQSPKKALHDFGSTYLWQIDFTKNFYDVNLLDSTGCKEHIQSEIGDYIIINGKSVNEWNNEVFNSVMIHVRTNGTFGQYLEVNSNSIIDGLIDENKDNTVTILAGFPDGGENSLKEAVSYFLPANSTAQFQRLDEVVDIVETTKPDDESNDKADDKADNKADDEKQDVEILDEEKSDNHKVGIIAGIVLGAVVVAAVIVFLIVRAKKNRETARNKDVLDENN